MLHIASPYDYRLFRDPHISSNLPFLLLPYNARLSGRQRSGADLPIHLQPLGYTILRNRSASVASFSPSTNTMLLRTALLSILSHIFSMAFSVNFPEMIIASFAIRCRCFV